MRNLSSIQFKHIDSESNTSGYHRVAAIAGEKKIGHLDWDGNETGRVNMVHVDEEHRRQGVATSLWNEAREVAGREGLVAPKHTKPEEMSSEGLAWSKKVK